MIGKGSIVVVSSSAVSLSRANAVGVAIDGASDITGNAGTIIVGSYRTVRASASDGTSIRIGRHVLPYWPIRVGNSHLRAAEWREREALWCLVECGCQYGNTVDMLLFSNCLKKTFLKFCLFYISLYICRREPFRYHQVKCVIQTCCLHRNAEVRKGWEKRCL